MGSVETRTDEHLGLLSVDDRRRVCIGRGFGGNSNDVFRLMNFIKMDMLDCVMQVKAF